MADSGVGNGSAQEQRPSTPPSQANSAAMTAQAPGTGPALASTLTAAGMSPPRPHYIPQFTAATEMLLKRMRGESSTLSAALSPAGGRRPNGTIQPSTYEDVKRRLISGMNTSSSLTMSMPAPAPPTRETASTAVPRRGEIGAPSKQAGQSIIRKISAGLVGKNATAAKPGQARSSPGDVKKPKVAPAKAGRKRKRGRGSGDDESSWLSSPSGSEDESKAAAPLTTTKSGRHVTKPTTYNPSAMDSAAKKRVNYGKRTPEEVLCKWCTRWADTDDNQMVFCDGCSEGWHQRCHEPWIDDAVVNDSNKSWYCKACQAKRSKDSGKKKPQAASNSGRGSWAGKTAGQVRVWLTVPEPGY